MQFAPNLQTVINLTKEAAKKYNQAENVSLLFAQIILFEKKFQEILKKGGLDPSKIAVICMENLPQVIPNVMEEPLASEELEKVYAFAKESSAELKDGYVDTEHVLHAILSISPTIKAWMEICEFPRIEFIEELQSLMTFQKNESSKQDSPEEESAVIPQNIQRYCRNITAEVMQTGEQVFGREKEIDSIIDTLVRNKKNNALLIGENGVGRKSICRGIAEKILFGHPSEFIAGKIIYELDVTKLTGGATVYGALEMRVDGLFKELDQEGDAILVIPNIASTVGAGNKEGSMDVASLIKTGLANPKIPIIGICTQSEYKKSLEKDNGLINQFEILRVEEPSKEEVRKMLINSLENIQQFHLVNVEMPVIDEIIDLCERFLPYKKFPEKAFDVLDFICAKHKNDSYKHPKEVQDLENEFIKKFHANIEKDSPEYKRLEKMGRKIEKKLETWAKKIANNPPQISVKECLAMFAEKYKLTDNQINQIQSSSILDIVESIKKEVHGQDHAVEKVCDVLSCTKVGLRDKTKPLGKFLFVGNTSTGKSFLAKKIAKYYFGDEKAMMRLDMSEFQEKYSISALIGSTAGYIGYESGGRLTEFVKHNPSCVVLFDEVEKASPDVHNLLLQIMDEGCLTDGQGYRVDFTNTIIIMTGNLGQGDTKRSMGFINNKEPDESFLAAVKKQFRPELLARIDDTVVFRDVDSKMMMSILMDSTNRVISCLKEEQLVDLTIDQTVLNHLLALASNQDAHARNIHAIVRRELEVPLAKILLKNHPKTLTAKLEEKNINFH